jgi:hypothetical protein
MICMCVLAFTVPLIASDAKCICRKITPTIRPDQLHSVLHVKMLRSLVMHFAAWDYCEVWSASKVLYIYWDIRLGRDTSRSCIFRYCGRRRTCISAGDSWRRRRIPAVDRTALEWHFHSWMFRPYNPPSSHVLHIASLRRVNATLLQKLRSSCFSCRIWGQKFSWFFSFLRRKLLVIICSVHWLRPTVAFCFVFRPASGCLVCLCNRICN